MRQSRREYFTGIRFHLFLKLARRFRLVGVVYLIGFLTPLILDLALSSDGLLLGLSLPFMVFVWASFKRLNHRLFRHIRHLHRARRETNIREVPRVFTKELKLLERLVERNIFSLPVRT